LYFHPVAGFVHVPGCGVCVKQRKLAPVHGFFMS
jgi:hypothetical protein